MSAVVTPSRSPGGLVGKEESERSPVRRAALQGASDPHGGRVTGRDGLAVEAIEAGGRISWQSKWQFSALAYAEEVNEAARAGAWELIDYVADVIDSHRRAVRLHLPELAAHLAVAEDVLIDGRSALHLGGYLAPVGHSHRWLAIIPRQRREAARRGGTR